MAVKVRVRGDWTRLSSVVTILFHGVYWTISTGTQVVGLVGVSDVPRGVQRVIRYPLLAEDAPPEL